MSAEKQPEPSPTPAPKTPKEEHAPDVSIAAQGTSAVFQSCTIERVYHTPAPSEPVCKPPDTTASLPPNSTSCTLPSVAQKCSASQTPQPEPQSPPDVVQVSSAIYHLWYLPVTFGKSTVNCFLDSGAMVSVMRKDIYDLLPANKHPLLPFPGVVKGISASPTHVHGQCVMPYTIDGIAYEALTVVADIGPSVLLGLNFLIDNKAVVDYELGQLKLNGREYILTSKRENRARRLTMVNNITIAPRSETTVEMKPRQGNKRITSSVVVSPLHDMTRRTGLIMGHTLSQPVKSRFVMATVINPTDSTIVLDKGTDLGLAFPAERVTPISEPSKPTEAQTTPEHVTSMIERTPISTSEKEQLRNVIGKHLKVFAPTTGPDTRTTLTQHEIETGDALPIRQKVRRLPLAQQSIATEEINKMLDNDVIEPSDSPWAAPIVLVRKKDGSMRFCVDYRRLNNITRKDSYPLPNIDDTFDALGGAQYFCALDLAAGYWQVPMNDNAKAKSAFITKDGLFQFKVMPFGLCNAPATFERLMDRVLRGHLGNRCLVYIDDVIVYGKDFNSTLQNLDTILGCLEAAQLQLKAKKCDLFQKEILYLGFRISGEGIRPDPAKTAAVTNWPRPCNVTDVRAFLGFASYHRRFIQDFSAIADPLTRLSKKNVKFSWSDEQEIAFTRLKTALVSAPMLHHPVPDAPFVLDTDASAYALGGVLSQVIDGVERVVGYASQTLSKAQRNYCTTHRELLAVVQMTRHFRHYLWGRRFHLRTDHSSIRWLLNYKDTEGMIARWLARLQEFDFSIEHRPGNKHLNADGLSRCHSCKNPQCPGYTGLPMPTSKRELKRIEKGKNKAPIVPKYALDGPNMVTPVITSNAPENTAMKKLDKDIKTLPWLRDFTQQDVAAAQRADPNLKPIIQWLENGEKPNKQDLAPLSEETKALAARLSTMNIKEDLLYKTGMTSRLGRPVTQLVLPNQLRELVLHQLHDLRVAGHLGIQRTIARVQERFYWPGLSIDVARWCAACSTCAGRKGKPGPGRVPMQSLPTGAPFERIAVDILDTRKVTTRKFQYVLVITDYFTKFTDAFPLRRHTAPVVADIIMRRWIAYHGVPKQLHSDQGAEFEGHLIKSLSKLLGFAKIRTTPYRPQSDGMVERFNRSLLNMLSAFVTERALDWDDHLPYVLMAYRTSRHSSTGCTPYSMVYGRECNLPVDLIFPDPQPEQQLPSCGPEYVDFIRKAIQCAHEFARDHLQKATVRQKKGYDAHSKDRPPFQVGDHVRYYYPPSKTTNKFARPWVGPFIVLERTSTVDYKIQLVSNPAKVRVVHIDNLKPFETPYSTNTDLNIRYEPGPEVLDDHPDHVDLPQTTDEPVVDQPTAPEMLQTHEDEISARQRVKRTIRPPKRYGFSPPKTPKKPKTPKPKNPPVKCPKPTKSSKSSIVPKTRPKRPVKLPQRYVDVTEAVKALMSIFHPGVT